MRHPLQLAAVLSMTFAALCTGAWAQSGYPRKPILMLVPLQAASAVDNAARIVAQRMSENMGQQIIVENQPGAAGLIGAEKVARAAPDGYTIGGFNDSVMTMLPNMYAKLSWDILKDFEPVSLVAKMEWALVTSPSSPYANAGDVIAAAKAKPGALNYGSGGNGSPQHIAMELFNARAGVSQTHVPYKGASAAALDTASGQVNVCFQGMPTVFSLIKGGKLKLIGVASQKRSTLFPDAPTVAEGGLPGFEFTSWFGVVVPAGTPKEIVARLNAEIAKVCASPAYQAKVAATGSICATGSVEDFVAFVKRERVKWGDIVRRSNAKID